MKLLLKYILCMEYVACEPDLEWRKYPSSKKKKCIKYNVSLECKIHEGN